MQLEPYKDLIINKYVLDGMTTTMIASEIGASQSGVEGLLKRYGVEMKPDALKMKVCESDRDKIADLYRSGLTSIEIGKMFNIADKTVTKIARSKGVDIRRAVRRSIIQNHRYFEDIDTADKAYFLGWMVTDGSVVESKSRASRSKIIALELQSGDEYIIKTFADFLGANDGSVKKFEKRGHSYLRFASEDMATDLQKYGVVPNKTYTAYLPIIREELMSHLIRGIFDGNGTATIDKSGNIHFALYGTEDLCTQVRDYLFDKTGLKQGAVSKSTCYHTWWYGNDSAKRFYNYVYKDSDGLCLIRKQDKFKKYI